VDLALALTGSFVAAFLGAAVGLVLGSVRLPAILLAAGSAPAAAGTNIAISTVAAATGAVAHARAGRVDWRVVAWMTPPSVAGAFVGGYFGHAVPERALLALIAAVLALNGLDLALELRPPRRRARHPAVAAAAAGAVIGLLGGAVGLILGTLRLPALLGPVALGAHAAVGTNLVVGVFLGLAGFAAHLVRLEVEWTLLAAGLAGAVPGAWLGARTTGRLSERALRRAIGVALLAVSAVIAIGVVRGGA
jgi:uncharacterized membrane protein YfcA